MSIDAVMAYPCYSAINSGTQCILSDDERPEVRAVPIFTSLDQCKAFIGKFGGDGHVTFKAPEDLVQYLFQESQRKIDAYPVSQVYFNLDPSDGTYSAYPINDFMEHVRANDTRSPEEILAAADFTETFNQSRMERCQKVVSVIQENWRRKNSFEITLRATESLNGKSFSDLQKCYFSVGAGDQLTDLPFLDLIVVIDTLRQMSLAHQRNPTPKDGDKVEFQLRTAFTFAEAASLLATYPVETPFDKGSHLRIQHRTELK